MALAATSASRVLCASLVCAQATADVLGQSDAVTYVISGRSTERHDIDDGDDDRAVAEYIDDARFAAADAGEAVRRVAESSAAAALRRSGIPEADIELSVRVDAFPAVLSVVSHNEMLTINRSGRDV